jgi:hypothetical protein
MEWSTFWNSVGAVGSILVAIMAIWGEWVRSIFVGPKLKLIPHNFRGTITTLTEIDRKTLEPIRSYKAIYYHLRVDNSRRWVTAKNCRVLLRQLHRRGPDGEFHIIPLVVPLQFVWSPAEWAPTLQTVADNEILDLGAITELSGKFEPKCYVTSANFQGFVGPNEAVRYSLSIVADNYVSPKVQVFEVAWNGKWSENLDDMEKYVTIKEVFK